MSCKSELTGSCVGCCAIEVAAAVSRIDSMPAEHMQRKIQTICPTGKIPDADVLIEEIQKQTDKKAHETPIVLQEP